MHFILEESQLRTIKRAFTRGDVLGFWQWDEEIEENREQGIGKRGERERERERERKT